MFISAIAKYLVAGSKLKNAKIQPYEKATDNDADATNNRHQPEMGKEIRFC